MTEKTKKTLSIRTIMMLVFSTIMLITVGVIGVVGFTNRVSTADTNLKRIVRTMNNDIHHQIEILMDIPLRNNEINQKLIDNEIVDLLNEVEREKFFVGALQSQDESIYSFSIGMETGEYYGARRNETGVIEIMRNNAETDGHSWYYSVNEDLIAGELAVVAGKFDPRTRAWYKVAQESGNPGFSPVYKHFVMEDLTVSAAYPIYNPEGILQGVLGTHIILSSIDQYLKDSVEDVNGITIIAEKETGDIVGNSLGVKNFIVREDESIDRVSINEIENLTIIQAYDIYRESAQKQFKVKSDKENFYIHIQEFHEEGIDWLVISAIPEGLLMADIYANMRISAVIAFVAAVISTIIYLLIASNLFKPINYLVDATQKYSQGDLSQRAKVIRNDELGRISYAYNNMAETISSLVNNLEAKVEERTLEWENINDELIENREQLQLILDSTAEAIYGIDNEGNCTFCNASSLRLLGYQEQDELLGKNMHWQIHHSHKDGSPFPLEKCNIFRSFKDGKGTHVDDEVFWKKDGASINVEYYSYPQFKDGKVIGTVVTFMDNSERKTAQERIKYLGEHDSLTGLYNRVFFENAMNKFDAVENLPVSIIFCDVNGLKLTNDIFGHAAGDALIKKCAEIMKEVCRDSDIVARVGGDEFIILLPNTDSVIAEKIIVRVKNELWKVKIEAINCSMSMGYETKTEIGQDIEKIMASAENKMYSEKTLKQKHIHSDMINSIITTLHDRSPHEKTHSLSVSELSFKLGKTMNLSETELKKLKDAGFYHDIGKIVFDDHLLKHEKPFTEEEIRDIQDHTVIGYRILNLFEDTLDLAEYVYSHHEKWDGSGYPKGLKGKEIPLLARIISLAEGYDTMVIEDRENIECRKKALIQIEKMSGTKFDPEIADIFFKMMSETERIHD
ncbi:MAG TPA: diguanylate cyclase [Anaerolineaceae bacterium]|nr:diguanylate cyclase [Anaerolineaceae bacterium]